MTQKKDALDPKYPGELATEDGSAAVVAMETAASEAAGAYPITPSTQMGEGWALAMAAGKTNVNGRALLFFEPEGEHAAAGVTAGMSMTGLRATNFSSGQGIAYMHESLYAAVGKRLTYVLNVACRAITKHSLNVHAGHDDYHAIDDTGFFQLFAKDVQEAADLTLIAHRIAELSLNPGICAQDGFLTSHVIETLRMPERELVKEYLGDPSDMIDSPTPAQRMVFGEKRRRIPELFDYDYPAMIGVVQNQESYAQGVAAQRPFYFDHIVELADFALVQYAALTGRQYARVTNYRTDDAEYVFLGQGSVIANAEAVVDHLRKTRGLKIGVVNVTMFRPFPADLLTKVLRGKKGVTVLERTDQPLAVDLPLLREVRAAMSKALENAQAKGALPFAGITPCRAEEMPAFYSGCFGLGSRDLQPGDLIAAAENMLAEGAQRRQFYLGIDFVRKGTRLPKLQIHQEKILESYPRISELALDRAANVDLMPEGAVSIRIHSVGGWGAITMGKNLAITAAELLGLHMKANPKYGSEKKGQPTTFYATLADQPIRTNCELKHVNVVLSPDSNVFHHSDPLAGLSKGGVFILQSSVSSKELWDTLPKRAQRRIREEGIHLYHLDGFAIAHSEASDPELRYRMQGAAFLGAFFKVSPLMKQSGLTAEKLFDGIHAQLKKKFGKLGEKVVQDNLRVIERGFQEVQEVPVASLEDSGIETSHLLQIPKRMDGQCVRAGYGNPGEFFEQVSTLYKLGEDVLADPFTAMSVMPAASSSVRDMSVVRFSVPEFIPENCTGCSQCWTQCPDSAIPGVVSDVEDVLRAAIKTASRKSTLNRVKQIEKPLAKEAQRILGAGPFTNFETVLSQAYAVVVEKLGLDPEKRRELDQEFVSLFSVLEGFPLAKTRPFFDLPESKAKGSGGLLAITINPDTCKGCDVCIAVCPDDALRPVRQTDEVEGKLRRNWELWQNLPETKDRYVNIASLEEGIGVLPSLLLKQSNYFSMIGGDGACMGCGEKTVIHLVVSAVEALMQKRVMNHVANLERLIEALDTKARTLLTSEADLDTIADTIANKTALSVAVSAEKKLQLELIVKTLHQLKDLHWRYTEGPSGKGRAPLGFANSTGCTSVWGATYPYNPYPFPWVNHLFQDSPSVAIGIFEGHMRKMADGFATIRRAKLILDDRYDAERDEKFFTFFDWRKFDTEEFELCPPIFSVGGDGAMLDIGFQNLSRLMASGKPIRVMVVDTQVYSNTGGQACTSGYTAQVSDMAAYGSGQRGKEEVRKELALLSIAHRGVFVVQSSQASASHLLGSVLQGLQSRRPAVFIFNAPCPPEWGIADDAAPQASRLALESRAFPHLVYDPDGGEHISDCLSLDGNPALDEVWPSYELVYIDDEGQEAKMTLPVTIADWAAHEARFRKQFRPVPKDLSATELVPFHEYVARSREEREGVQPFIYTLDAERRLDRLLVSDAVVELAEDRLRFWSQLKELAGLELSSSLQEIVTEQLQREYEAKLLEMKTRYPKVIARRLMEGLLKSAQDGDELSDVLTETDLDLASPSAREVATSPATTIAPTTTQSTQKSDDSISIAPYIESERCTSCDECTNLNPKLFAYNAKKQAYIVDPKFGSFKDLVTAAERCPAEIIHPGTPQNPKEKNLDVLIKRAQRFN